MPNVLRIAITTGEPAGIGPDIVIRIAQQVWPVELIALGDPALLTERAQRLNLPLVLNEVDLSETASLHVPGALKIYPIKLTTAAEPGTINPMNAQYVIQQLKEGAALCQNKIAHALVTAPVHKALLNQAGINFTGHTEFFAQYCHAPQTVMLFIVNKMKVALVTTHIPLAKVPETLTAKRLQLTLSILREALQNYFKLIEPRILVCGLNPHAGEGGYLGREEIDVIRPTLSKLRAQGYQLEGPLPADTIFTKEFLKRADAILAMYHDQALPVVKYLGFGNAVNVTLGLPFIRTSVDHGTALDIAGTDKADASSLAEALRLGIRLARC